MRLGKFAKGSICFIGCSVINMVFTFGITPFITRMLAQEQYGFVSVYNTWHSILQIVLTLNLFGGYYETLLTREPDNKIKISHRLMTLTTVVTIAGSAILLIVWESLFGFSGISSDYLLIMCLDIFVYSFVSCWYTFTKLGLRYLEYTILYLSVSLGKCLFSIALMLLMDDRQLARIIGLTIPDIIACIYVIARSIYLKRVEAQNGAVYKVTLGKDFRSALLFNIPLIPHYLSNIVLSSSDRIMINSINGEAQAGIYSLAYSYASLVSIVLYATNSALSPLAYQCIKENDYKKLSDSFSNVLLIGGVASIGAMLIAPEAMKILAPASYYEGVYLIPPLIIGIVLTFFYNCYSYVEFYYKKNRTIAVATCIAAAINIVANAIFLPRFGYAAAAYTTILGYLILSVLHAITSYRIVRKNIIPIKTILLFSVVMLIVSSLIFVSYYFFLLRMAIALAMIVLVVAFRKKMWAICAGILKT